MTPSTITPPPGIREQRVEAGVLRWTIDNPDKRNAIHPRVLAWIAARASTLAAEVVLLTSAGGHGFSAGFDLSALPEVLERAIDALPDEPLIRATAAMERADATFVGVLRGYVIGAGVELACACDLRIARPDTWFKVPAGKLGVVYHARGLQRFRAVFGPGLTRRLMLLGEALQAAEVLAVGGLVRLVDEPALDDAALTLARRLHAMAPASTRGHRDLLRALDRAELADDDDAATHERRRHAAYRDRGDAP